MVDTEGLTEFADDEGEGERTVIRAGQRRGASELVRRSWAHYLVYLDDGGVLQRLRLGPTKLRIGRRAPSEVILRDSEVSGLHCEVELRGDDVFVRDLGSTNGTFVDGQRVAATVALQHGALLQVGRQMVKHEFRDELEVMHSQELDRDLERARHYVLSLLPQPLRGGPLRIEWFFQPSAKVGGDGFGYHALDEHRWLIYIVDVSGHGVGAAMHVVTVMNALRGRALPDCDFADPSQVLGTLNRMFQMESHDGMFFTIWYGVVDLRSRRLAYACGGHHPAYLRQTAGGTMRPLATRNLVIGAVPEAQFSHAVTEVAPGERLYLFSDGVFEIVTRDGQPWGLDEFLQLPGRPHDPAVTEPQDLFGAVRALTRPGPLDDDFSLLVVDIP
jgi:serine phosphatase RsbU (regulator of sigma subunit)